MTDAKSSGIADRDPVDDATLALLLEVAGTPKPGNVDRHRDLGDLHFESFLGGAIGARAGLELAAIAGDAGDAGDASTGGGDDSPSLGRAFERGVAGMADRAGTNTQFGCLLSLVPLLRATAEGDLTPPGLDRVTRATTVDDAIAFYRAFEHVDVAVADPPADADELDVRQGVDAAPALRARETTLRDVMALSAGVGDSGPDGPERVPDRNAQEWVEGFPRTFRAAEWMLRDEGPLTDRAARAFLGLLAAEPDTLVAANHGPETARETSERAAALLGGAHAVDSGPDGVADPSDIDAAAVHDADLDAAEELAAALVEEGINPGTTADLVCAALYVALRRGAEVSS
ncbi:triphosphoribosyl-dephospho-CoA synthase [Halorubrum sp. DTA46]|uniref:triphosphoribosyl-dephospho-CoA synthase n=1 Tax=Halorubrum sp. DTA46 TaxID=3402162 RepID=UPI003AB02127